MKLYPIGDVLCMYVLPHLVSIQPLIYIAIYISGSSSSVDLSSLTRANQSTEASALLYLLQTYARANNEEKTHPKVNRWVQIMFVECREMCYIVAHILYCRG